MAMLSFCGVDVSKDRLDVVVLPEGWFFSVRRPISASSTSAWPRWLPLDRFKNAGTQVIIYPKELASGELQSPYSVGR